MGINGIFIHVLSVYLPLGDVLSVKIISKHNFVVEIHLRAKRATYGMMFGAPEAEGCCCFVRHY